MGYNKITLFGKQTCDYLHIQKTEPSDEETSYVNTEPKIWNENTLLLSAFNNNLDAGNSALVDKIDGYEIRRRRGSEPYSEYVCTLEKNKNKYIIDYLTANNNEYSYYIYPSSSKQGIVLSPFKTEDVRTRWNYWSLIIVDESAEKNVYYMNKIFKFEFNLTINDMNNNSNANVTQNFTKYPTVQYSTSNYWSGSLSALCGYISCKDNELIQTPNMIKELKSLNSESRKMFLKNCDGDIWEVKLNAPLNITTDNSFPQLKTVKLSWVEVGEVSNISIINNPNMEISSWILTEDGQVVEYKEYIWDEHYRWDNSYIWTSHEDILENKTLNLGRRLTIKDGDEDVV